MLFQQILNGLTNGSLYALMAVGVTMVYKSLGMLNFAHGDIMMVGTFITLTFITKLGLPFYVSVPLGIICAAGLGFLLERVILRKVKFSSFVNLLIATVGVPTCCAMRPWSSGAPTRSCSPACSPLS